MGANSTLLECTPSATGNFTVTATVSDAHGVNVNRLATLGVNPILEVSRLSVSPALLDQEESFDLTAHLSGGTGPLSYDYLGLPTGCASKDSPELDCLPTENGTFSVEIIVIDSVGASANAYASVQIANDLKISEFEAVHDVIDLGQLLQLSASTTGGSGNLSYAFAKLPGGCSGTNQSCTELQTDGRGLVRHRADRFRRKGTAGDELIASESN